MTDAPNPPDPRADRDVVGRVLADLTPPYPLTAAELWNRTWYAVVDDEVGGYAIATVDRPTSHVNPVATRDRVLFWVVWEEHARWLVELHNASLGRRPADEPADACHDQRDDVRQTNGDEPDRRSETK